MKAVYFEIREKYKNKQLDKLVLECCEDHLVLNWNQMMSLSQKTLRLWVIYVQNLYFITNLYKYKNSFTSITKNLGMIKEITKKLILKEFGQVQELFLKQIEKQRYKTNDSPEIAFKNFKRIFGKF